jgi:hypothetical protein
MIRYLIANARFKIQSWWLHITGHDHDEAPGSLLRAYDKQAEAWNRRQDRRT